MVLGGVIRLVSCICGVRSEIASPGRAVLQSAAFAAVVESVRSAGHITVVPLPFFPHKALSKVIYESEEEYFLVCVAIADVARVWWYVVVV